MAGETVTAARASKEAVLRRHVSSRVLAANLVRRYWRDEQAKLRAYAKTGIDPVLALDDRLHRTREQLQNRLADNGQSAANAVNATKEEGR